MPGPPYPSVVPTADKTNDTLQEDDHPDHHNGLAQAAAFLKFWSDAAQTTLTSVAASISSLNSSVTTFTSEISALQATDTSLQNQINAIASSGSDATAVAAALAAHAAAHNVHGVTDTTKLIASSDGTILNEIVLTRSAFNALSGSYVTGTIYWVRP